MLRIRLPIEAQNPSQGRSEIGEKVKALVATRFGGDYRAAFANYDADGNGAIDGTELKVMLSDAGSAAG